MRPALESVNKKFNKIPMDKVLCVDEQLSLSKKSLP